MPGQLRGGARRETGWLPRESLGLKGLCCPHKSWDSRVSERRVGEHPQVAPSWLLRMHHSRILSAPLRHEGSGRAVSNSRFREDVLLGDTEAAPLPFPWGFCWDE